MTPASGASHLSEVVHRQWRSVYRAGGRARRSVRRRLGPRSLATTYDAQTIEVMRRVLTERSNGIDIGAAWGEMLRPMVKLAGSGHHRAVEPLPQFAARLREEFPDVQVFELALSDHNGECEFRHVIDAPAFSGIHRRPLPSDGARVETFVVDVRRLDDLIDLDERVDFIKIDVEGAEFDVLRGARECLTRHRPVVVFEYSGKAIPEHRDRNGEFYGYLHGLGLSISTMDRWLRREAPLEASAFPRLRGAQEWWDWMYVAYDGRRWPTSVP